MKIVKIIIFLLIPILFSFACATSPTNEEKSKKQLEAADQQKKRPLLRVGLTPNYPPVVFLQDDNLSGIEVDFARQLGLRMNMQVQTVEMAWDRLIPSLMEDKIDIIMSGMTITKARQMRIDFSDSYLKTGQMAMMRRADADKFPNVDSMLLSKVKVGIQKGTTGDTFVQQNFPNATTWEVASPKVATFDMLQRKIDLFVHDAPSVMWQVSENESELVGLWEFLTEEQLGWGVRRGNQELLDNVSNELKEMKADGTLDKIIKKWLPYMH